MGLDDAAALVAELLESGERHRVVLHLADDVGRGVFVRLGGVAVVVGIIVIVGCTVVVIGVIVGVVVIIIVVIIIVGVIVIIIVVGCGGGIARRVCARVAFVTVIVVIATGGERGAEKSGQGGGDEAR